MAQSDVYNTIVVSENPRGRFLDVYLGAANMKPGTIVQIEAAVEPIGGVMSVVPYSRDADGDRPQGPIMVLVEDQLQGDTITGTYSENELGRVYIPLPGDELLCLMEDVAGTDTDTYAIGDILMVDSGTGLLKDTSGSIETEPFMVMETVSSGYTANTLTHVMYSGH